MRSAGGIGLLAAVAATIAIAAPAAASACPALDYQATLAAAAASLHAAPPDVAGALRDVTGLLARDAGRGQVLAPIVADLAAVPAQLTDSRLRLDSISAALAYPPGSTCNEDSSAARSTLHDVYAAPALRHLDDATQPNFIDSALRFLAGPLGRAAGALGLLGGLALAVLLLGLATALAWRRWRASAASRPAVAAEPSEPGDDPEAEWVAAERAAEAGQYREAVRRAFRAGLVDVAIQGRVRLDASWTTRELLARCSADGETLAALAAAATLFDSAWYSGRPVMRQDWDLAAERCRALRTLARRPVGALP